MSLITTRIVNSVIEGGRDINSFLSVEKRKKLVIGAQDMFRDYSHLPQDCHEVRIANPPGNYMEVEMLLDPRTCDLPYIQPDIKPFGKECLLQALH